MLGLGAGCIDVDHERVAVLKGGHYLRPLHMERANGGLLCEQSAGDVNFGGEHHLRRQLAERHAARPEVRAVDGFPEIGDCPGLEIIG